MIPDAGERGGKSLLLISRERERERERGDTWRHVYVCTYKHVDGDVCIEKRERVEEDELTTERETKREREELRGKGRVWKTHHRLCR